MNSLKINPSVDQLHDVMNFIHEQVPNKDIKLDLVIEEIFVNIAKYAYKDSQGKCSLTIQNDVEGKLDFIFEDSGIPFNPLENKEPDITLSAEERDIGGLGILITKKIMDNIQYKYENNKNVLKITKYIK